MWLCTYPDGCVLVYRMCATGGNCSSPCFLLPYVTNHDGKTGGRPLSLEFHFKSGAFGDF